MFPCREFLDLVEARRIYVVVVLCRSQLAEYGMNVFKGGLVKTQLVFGKNCIQISW